MNAPALMVEGLNVTYGAVHAVRDVCLTAEHGKLACVLGANGAGKSSMMWAIAGVNKCTGVVTVGGSDVTRWTPDQRVGRGLVLVPETGRIFRKLTVGENLRLALMSGRTRGADQETLSAVLDRFPVLGERLSQAAGQLSGGESQQLAIARGLLLKPSVLLLDEPSFGLAPLVIDGVFDQLASLRAEGLAILMVEQNAAKALPLADYVYVLAEGRVVESGTPDEIGNSEGLLQTYLGGQA